MLFEKDETLELQPRRTKTLMISVGIHVLLLAVIVINPDFLVSTPKRIIRIAGQDYDLSKNQITELVLPPDALRPKPAPQPQAPLVEPTLPAPQQAPPPPPPPQQAPPPPPPPPPPQPQMPPVTITPEDVIAEGARPDAQPRASRGDTRESARVGGGSEEPKPEPTPRQQAQNDPPLIARNTNPNAMRLPNILDSADRIIDQSLQDSRRRYAQGPRTGNPGPFQDEPNFSTEEPTILSDTRGYDFGPYMNGVVNRVRINWYSLIPEIARLGKRGRVVITFVITEDGTVQNIQLRANSGSEPLDRAALGAISASNPFAKLPANFDGDHLVLQFTFLYNIR